MAEDWSRLSITTWSVKNVLATGKAVLYLKLSDTLTSRSMGHLTSHDTENMNQRSRHEVQQRSFSFMWWYTGGSGIKWWEVFTEYKMTHKWPWLPSESYLYLIRMIFILDSWAIRYSLNECYKTRTILREILSIIWVLYYGWHFEMESSHRWNSSLLSSDLYWRCTSTCFTSTCSTKIILSFTFDELQGCMFSNKAMALINF